MHVDNDLLDFTAGAIVATAVSIKLAEELIAANNAQIKNIGANHVPPGISRHNFGIVINNSPGPDVISILYANRAGTITRAARIEAVVLKKTVQNEALIMSAFFERYEP